MRRIFSIGIAVMLCLFISLYAISIIYKADEQNRLESERAASEAAAETQATANGNGSVITVAPAPQQTMIPPAVTTTPAETQVTFAFQVTEETTTVTTFPKDIVIEFNH